MSFFCCCCLSFFVCWSSANPIFKHLEFGFRNVLASWYKILTSYNYSIGLNTIKNYDALSLNEQVLCQVMYHLSFYSWHNASIKTPYHVLWLIWQQCNCLIWIKYVLLDDSVDLQIMKPQFKSRSSFPLFWFVWNAQTEHKEVFNFIGMWKKYMVLTSFKILIQFQFQACLLN